MMISVTRLRVKSITKIYPVVSLSGKIISEATNSRGNLHVWVGNRFLMTFYTMTVWESMEDLLGFVNSGTHKEAMQQSQLLARETSTVSFESDTIPKWKEAKARLLAKSKEN